MSSINPFELRILETADGSQTLYVPHLDERYHSHHGALTEARHIYILAGLLPFLETRPEARVLEIGFGTGLNALLSWEAAEKSRKKVYYHTLELNPLPAAVTRQLSWPLLLPELAPQYRALHEAEWDRSVPLSDYYTLLKQHTSVQDCDLTPVSYDVVYFDAFAPEKDPELWTAEVFDKMYETLKPRGALLTYCAKGKIKRLLRATGFTVEALPGPPGKREIVRAGK